MHRVWHRWDVTTQRLVDFCKAEVKRETWQASRAAIGAVVEREAVLRMTRALPEAVLALKDELRRSELAQVWNNTKYRHRCMHV